MSLNFKCPHCGGRDAIIEITEVASIGIPVKNIENEEDFEYGYVRVYNGFPDRYVCDYCGYIIRNNGVVVKSIENLIQYLKQQPENK